MLVLIRVKTRQNGLFQFQIREVRLYTLQSVLRMFIISSPSGFSLLLLKYGYTIQFHSLHKP